MANPGERLKLDSSIVDMEMEVIDDGDSSDYETNFGTAPGMDDPSSQTSGTKGDDGQQQFVDDVKKQMGQTVTSYMWQTGSQTAKKAFNVYANIDVLRPYFNVEPHEVRTRLLYSLFPQKVTNQRQKVYRELYGPTMIVFTLIALLLFQMKTSDHSVQEGTLMGSAFGVCFGYWLGVSSLMWVLAYICNTHITLLQILSLLGYGLFGHCIVVFSSTVIHASNSHMLFYAMWAVVGGLSTLKIISVIVSRTGGRTQRMIVCGTVAVLHLLFLLYLHFAYHRIVEEFSAVMQHAGNVDPVAPGDDNEHNMMPRDVDKIAKKVGRRVTPDNVPKVPPMPAKSPQAAAVPSAKSKGPKDAANDRVQDVIRDGGHPVVNDKLVDKPSNGTLIQKATNDTIHDDSPRGDRPRKSPIFNAVGNRAARVAA